MLIFEIFVKVKSDKKYTSKHTKLQQSRKFSRGSMPPNSKALWLPLSKENNSWPPSLSSMRMHCGAFAYLITFHIAIN